MIIDEGLLYAGLYRVREENRIIDAVGYYGCSVYPTLITYVTDKFINGYVGTDSNGNTYENNTDKWLPISYTTGKFSNCLYFNDYTYVLKPDTVSLNLNLNYVYTIDFRIKLEPVKNIYDESYYAHQLLYVKKTLTEANSQYDFKITIWKEYDTDYFVIHLSVYNGSTWKSMIAYEDINVANIFESFVHIAIVKRTPGSYPVFYCNGNPMQINTYGVSATDLNLGGSVVRDIFIIGGLLAPQFSKSVYNGSIRMGNSFSGWLDELRICRSAVWTGSFTPPTAAYTTSSASNTLLLFHFNGNLKEEVSGLNWCEPMRTYTGYSTYNGRYSLYIPPGTRHGIKAYMPYISLCGASGKSAGFTIEIIATSKNDTYNTTDQYLFYYGDILTSDSDYNIWIKKIDDSSVTGTCPGVEFHCGDVTVQTSGISCLSRKKYIISYNNADKMVYFYIDRTYIGGGQCSFAPYNATTKSNYAYVGFNPTVPGSSYNGYIGEYKYITHCKYSKAKNLDGSTNAYSTYFLVYQDMYSNANYIELDSIYNSAVLKQLNCRNYAKVRITAENGTDYDYFLPLTSYRTFASDVNVLINHPNGDQYTLATSTCQHKYLTNCLTNSSTLSSAANQWIDRYRTIGKYIFSSTSFSSTHPAFLSSNPTPPVGLSIRSSGFSQSNNYTDPNNVINEKGIVCDQLHDFNFAGNWTVDYYIYLDSASVKSNKQVVNMFDSFFIGTQGVYAADTNGSFLVSHSSFYKAASQWIYIGVRHPANTNQLYLYVDGAVLKPSTAITSDGSSEIVGDFSIYCVTGISTAGLITFNQNFFTKKSRSIRFATDSNYYLAAFRIRNSSIACTSKPTSKVTSFSNHVCLFYFEDLVDYPN